MKVTYLGQFGLLLETTESVIMVDPYLTDSIFERGKPDFRREVPPDPKFLAMRPDVILITHVHGDHVDIPSLQALLSGEKKAEVLASPNAWQKVRSEVGGEHNYVSLPAGAEWSTRDIHVRAVPAVHSDTAAVGFVIHTEGKTLYLSGDTLYDRAIIDAINEPIDCMFVVMNGLGNNMNCIDAARMAQALQPKVAVPVHWGLFKKFSDDPCKFVAEAEKRGGNAHIIQSHEQCELNDILGEE